MVCVFKILCVCVLWVLQNIECVDPDYICVEFMNDTVDNAIKYRCNELEEVIRNEPIDTVDNTINVGDCGM